MIITILKALLVGVIAAIPIGPIFVMVVQRTLCYGRSCGRMVGFGAALGDTFYAAVGLLAVTLLQGFIERNAAWIMIVGSVLVAWIGVGMLTRSVTVSLNDDDGKMSPWVCFGQGAVSTLSNPLALGVMMALLAMFGLGSDIRHPILLAPCVGLGECIYWFVLAAVLARYLKIDTRTMKYMSRIAGAAVCVFAVVLLVRGILMLTGS